MRSSEAERAREEFRRYQRDADRDPLAAKRWWYWSTLARVKTMQQLGRPWEEIAYLLDLDPTDKVLWSIRQGDRRLKVAQEVVAEGLDHGEEVDGRLSDQ